MNDQQTILPSAQASSVNATSIPTDVVAVSTVTSPASVHASSASTHSADAGRRPAFGGSGRGRGQGGGGRMGGRGRRGPGRGPQGKDGVPLESDYEEKNVEVARVTRVTKGGKRMRFRALTVIGNRKGRVGYGLAKGTDVAGATGKATTKARKALFTVPLVNETIPHPVEAKFSAAHILLKPAPKGTGVKAGGAVRIVLELAGVPNVVSKILGSSNKINNVKATFVALRALRLPTRAPQSVGEEKQAIGQRRPVDE